MTVITTEIVDGEWLASCPPMPDGHRADARMENSAEAAGHAADQNRADLGLPGNGAPQRLNLELAAALNVTYAPEKGAVRELVATRASVRRSNGAIPTAARGAE
jgi:hypothetical protein